MVCLLIIVLCALSTKMSFCLGLHQVLAKCVKELGNNVDWWAYELFLLTFCEYCSCSEAGLNPYDFIIFGIKSRFFFFSFYIFLRSSFFYTGALKIRVFYFVLWIFLDEKFSTEFYITVETVNYGFSSQWDFFIVFVKVSVSVLTVAQPTLRCIFEYAGSIIAWSFVSRSSVLWDNR